MSAHAQRRVARELAAIRVGQHPLSTRLGKPVALGRNASKASSPKGVPTGPVCGGCVHRQDSDGRPPLCRRVGQAGGVIPKWWPPCTAYQARPRTIAAPDIQRGVR
jgi:hypothetical protein